jgi:hypothetical protein
MTVYNQVGAALINCSTMKYGRGKRKILRFKVQGSKFKAGKKYAQDAQQFGNSNLLV